MLSIMENPEIANIQHAFYRFCHLLTSMFFMSKGYKNFLTWIKSELQAGHHVTIGVTDEKDFSYSHIVSIVIAYRLRAVVF